METQNNAIQNNGLSSITLLSLSLWQLFLLTVGTTHSVGHTMTVRLTVAHLTVHHTRRQQILDGAS